MPRALTITACTVAFAVGFGLVGAAPPVNLVANPRFSEPAADVKSPAHFTIHGDAIWSYAGKRHESADCGVALDSGSDLNGDGRREGDVSQLVTGLDPSKSHWYRFSIRGMPEPNFAVSNDDLYMRVEFFGKAGADFLDGVTRKIYPLVERDRRELAVNGVRKRNGAAVWKTYSLEFRLPFPTVDSVRLIAGFRGGVATATGDAAFLVTDFALTQIADPADSRPSPQRPSPGPSELTPLGGRWFYRFDGARPDVVTVRAENAGRLYFRDHNFGNPFAANMTAWLRKGNKDRSGSVLTADRFVTDNVVVEFRDDKTMIVRCRNIPNHPTAIFPEIGGGNPSYIQEHDYVYYLPLEPKRNRNAKAMDATNSNRALPMGTIGIAINGVAFYNPFDAGMTDATDLMDRCCGHPSPDNRYHYHKYPVCVKSPFVDEGDDHSPLIGWALDGFPIYGPYEAKGVMAKDSKDNPLNEFNVHHDDVRGWHYHVTPGKYPYVIGGFWGEVDRRNLRAGRR